MNHPEQARQDLAIAQEMLAEALFCPNSVHGLCVLPLALGDACGRLGIADGGCETISDDFSDVVSREAFQKHDHIVLFHR